MGYEQTADQRAGAPRRPPPGWYPDPAGLRVLRWWDGAQWGSHTQPLPGIGHVPQPPYPDATAAASEGYGGFGQQSIGRHRQQGGLQDLGLASDPYRASFPPVEPERPDTYQLQEPEGRYQPQELPQQASAPGPQLQPHRAVRRPRSRKVRNALIGLGTLIGIIVAISVATARSQNWYADGKAFVLRDNKVDSANLVGPPGIVQKWCTGVVDTGTAPVPTGPLPPTADGSAATQWVSGCAEGYAETHPNDQDGTAGTIWDTSPAAAAPALVSPSASYTPLSLTCTLQYWIPPSAPFTYTYSASGWQPITGPQDDLGGG